MEPENSPFPTPPQPKKSNLAVILLSILLLVTLSATVYLFLRVQSLTKQLAQLQVQPTPTPLSTEIPSPTIDPTANWKTYQNEKYGFEVKYPLDFTEQRAESDTTLLKITKTDRGSLYDFVIRVIKNYKINQIVSKVGEVKEINIGDHSGYEYFYIEGEGMSEVALIQVGQDVLSISFDCIGSSQNFATPNDRKIYVQDFFDQILSTFKFLDEPSKCLQIVDPCNPQGCDYNQSKCNK